MVRKPLWLPLLLSFATMFLLYLMGYIFDISIFEFKLYEGPNLNTEIALLPIVIGIIVGFIVERMIIVKRK
ncbi:ATPase [Bacillus spongiae]|uniref:ATPase n=1 Tax=Bacillus spongiae TaxID=2683610 RepID=A0ABU8HHR3_9BACI